jgi:hypothetical protein
MKPNYFISESGFRKSAGREASLADVSRGFLPSVVSKNPNSQSMKKKTS